jgi:hypothetical protein
VVLDTQKTLCSADCNFLITANVMIYNVACRLKAGISESQRASIARQRPGSHVSCTIEVTFSWQRLGKCLFSQQQKKRFHDNGGINCSIRRSLVGKPSSYERECIRDQNTEVRIEATELRIEHTRSERRVQKTRGARWRQQWGVQYPEIVECVNYCNRVQMCQ